MEKLIDKRIGVFRNYIARERISDAPLRVASEEMIARCIFVTNQFVVREWLGAGMREPVELVARRMTYLGFLLADSFRFDERTSTEYIRTTLDYGAAE